MNLIANLKGRLGGLIHPDTKKKEPLSYEQLLRSLQRACAHMQDGEAFILMDKGEFSVRLTWTPDAGCTQKRLMFSLDGEGKATEWTDVKPDGVADTRIQILPLQREEAASAKESPRQSEAKPSRQQRMMRELVRYLKLNYAFRYNRLTERTECARLNPDAVEDAHHLIYTPVDTRTLNSIALDAIGAGIGCWDKDVKRYIESGNVPAYHPLELYFKNLPQWDGKDRITELARRVSDKEIWIKGFHRWLLACTAQWTDFGRDDRRANSVAPILISTRQGMGKSTFCRMLLPKPLQEYFTESFDLTNASSAENKLASYGLINLDEFDRLPATRMPQLKNLMQMESLRIRRAYRRNAEPLPRIASFIGTSNRTDLLTDLTGSRRFICVEVNKPIDCTTPIDHNQLYAQLLHELAQGERCWFSKEEEAEIQESNKAFYRTTPAEELISGCFEFAEAGEARQTSTPH